MSWIVPVCSASRYGKPRPASASAISNACADGMTQALMIVRVADPSAANATIAPVASVALRYAYERAMLVRRVQPARECVKHGDSHTRMGAPTFRVATSATGARSSAACTRTSTPAHGSR